MPETARCFKCKKQVISSNLHEEKTSNGRMRMKGTCDKCGSNVSTFFKKQTSSKENSP